MYNIINKKKLSCLIAIIFAMVFLLNYAMPATKAVQVLAEVKEATEQQYVTGDLIEDEENMGPICYLDVDAPPT